LALRPLECGLFDDTDDICTESEERVEISNKRGPFLFFGVDKKLEIKNIELNSIDSIIKSFDDAEDCLSTREQCCSLDEDSNELVKYDEGSSYDCSIKYGVSDTCHYLPVNNGLFRFNLSDKTHLTAPNQLIIEASL
jgi:hypothetical protein